MRIIDLFSGCGGLSLGFQNAGFEIVASFDNWQPAIRIYEKNFYHPIVNLDLSELTNFDMFKDYKADMIIGGPPCQDFSSAGKRNEQDRADLTIKFAEIITEVKPKYFVMENVDRITTTKTLKTTLEIFDKSGYGLSPKTLNASLCGVPQARKRFFLIGVLDEKDNILIPYLEKNLAKEPLTIFDYLGYDLGIEHYYRHPRSYARRAIFSIYEPSPTIRGVNRPIPKTYQFHEGDTTKDLEKVRPLTTLERSYLQTFPKNFNWDNLSKSDLEQVIGNAVPVKLAEYVANCIKEYINDKNANIEIKPKKMPYIQKTLFA
ncbi:MAG: DNA cytosine methyltransferase [Microscillaceae bacterium]|jgi:DNA (cytosine-5)-methyltransferase 1|nr:DNA cytosine methyltransferase [Microscillaceae bacterium]